MQFLHHGYDRLPPTVTKHASGLSSWKGIDGLRQSLRTMAGGTVQEPVLLANRSAQLMKLAARILFHPCGNVLTTDLDWPGYREILTAECRRANRKLTIITVRSLLIEKKLSAAELVDRLYSEFQRHDCDGLYLTAVSNDGVRLPIPELVARLESGGRSLFTVVDGAQDFCHAGSNFRECDLYLAGAHKWLQAYHPLGIAFYGRVRSKKRIERLLAKMIHAVDLDDPLLRLTTESLSNQCSPLQETFSPTTLITTQAAIEDSDVNPSAHRASFRQRITNGQTASELAMQTDWQTISPVAELRTGILMLRSDNPGLARQHPDTLREAFRDRNISLSTYPDGLIRLSMPAKPFTSDELTQLSDGLRSVNTLFG